MLSRTAENLYWLARYVERAEYLARTIDATLRVTALPATYIGKTNEWDSALLTAGVSVSFYEVYEEADEHNVVDYLSFSPSNPSPIRNRIENARRISLVRAGRTHREMSPRFSMGFRIPGARPGQNGRECQRLGI